MWCGVGSCDGIGIGPGLPITHSQIGIVVGDRGVGDWLGLGKKRMGQIGPGR